MSDLVIHHVNISYDESDERVRNFVKYLQSEKRKEEMQTYFKEAKGNQDGKIYVSDKSGNEFALICLHGDNCTFRLRGM